MHYVPAPGLKVRNPATKQFIGEDGIEVGPHDFDLARMVRQGDLVEVQTAAPAAPSQVKPMSAAPAAADKGE